MALTGWKAQRGRERYHEAANMRDERHSHPGKHREAETDVRRQRTWGPSGGTHKLASTERQKEMSGGSEREGRAVALTSWQAQRGRERCQEAANVRDERWHSHPGKHKEAERDVRRQRT